MVLAWAELCRDLTDEQFIEACKAHLRESRYFPCPADILKAHADMPPQRSEILAIPEQTQSPEEYHRGAVSSAMILAVMQKHPQAKDFFAAENWSDKERIARGVLGARYPESGYAMGRVVQ